VLYEASHVAGLIAGGHFQHPLKEGADIVSFSTHKSFGGPPGGAIVTDSAHLAEAVSKATYPGLTANYDAGRLPALLLGAVELARYGRDYAAACIYNARRPGAALEQRGFNVLAAERHYTASHHLAIDAAPLGGGSSVARHLADAGIFVSASCYPTKPSASAKAGVRVGTQEITRWGFTGPDIAELGDLWARLLIKHEDRAASDPK
jgi:glycine hydroxymethyltransferase